MRKKKNAIGLYMMMKLFDKHFRDLSVSQMQELINAAAAEKKIKEEAIRARDFRRYQSRLKEQEERQHREDIRQETDDLLKYLGRREQVI